MKYYEMLCVLPGTMTEEEVKSDVDLLSQSVAKYDAENVTLEDMGKSRLAYPIKHIRYGYFQLFKFNLEEDKIISLEKDIRLLGKLLRVTVSVCDPDKTVSYKLALDPTAPSAIPKPEKEGRDDRRSSRPMHRENTSEKTEKVTKVKKEVVEEKESSSAKASEDKEEKVEKKTVEVKAEKTKISVEDIDKKLDEILKDDIDKI